MSAHYTDLKPVPREAADQEVAGTQLQHQGYFSWLCLKHSSSFQKAPRTECAHEGLLIAAISQSGIPTDRRIKWSYPEQAGEEALERLLRPPLPPVTNGLLSPVPRRPLAVQAVCIQSTLCFYRPVEPKIARLLNPRLTSVWLQPHFLEPKSFLTTTQ